MHPTDNMLRIKRNAVGNLAMRLEDTPDREERSRIHAKMKSILDEIETLKTLKRMEK